MIIERKDRFNIHLQRLIAKAQAKLHVSPAGVVLLDWGITDKDGNLLVKHTGRSHSVVRNYSNMCLMAGTIPQAHTGSTYAAGSSACWKQDNSELSMDGYNIGHSTLGGTAGDTTTGIVVGTSDTAESFDQYSVGTLIAHGTGSGQMSYAALTTTTTWTSGTKTMANAIQRVITNNSSGSITVKEICIIDGVFTQRKSSGSTSGSMVVLRDVPSPIAVAAASALTITYTFSYVYP